MTGIRHLRPALSGDRLPHVWWLGGLSVLFSLRVLAQFVQWVDPQAFLPPFEVWHGDVLSYPVLLAFQVFILLGMIRVIQLVNDRRIRPARWKALSCFVIGIPYLIAMAFRLIAGLTFLAAEPWFARPLPAFFHLVLASYILVLGHYLSRYRESRRGCPC